MEQSDNFFFAHYHPYLTLVNLAAQVNLDFFKSILWAIFDRPGVPGAVLIYQHTSYLVCFLLKIS